MNFVRPGKSKRNGQVFVMFAIVLPILLTFAGLGIDYAFAYVTRATLSRAIDAAALAGMRNINQGPTQAKAIALGAFNVNYGVGLGRDSSPPVLNIVFSTDSGNNTVVNVNATVAINTFFLRVIGYNTLNVSSSSQVTRPAVIMSLILDKSGSMNLNGGARALPPAVANFLTYFDNATDQVAMVSFSSVASIDVTMRTNFLTPITTQVNSLPFGGATFSQAGLLDGQAQINGVALKPGQNVVKVAVFFTDGWANTDQDKLNCPPSSLLNFGGCSPPEAALGWCRGVSFMDPTSGSTTYCGATVFPAQSAGGAMESLTLANISNDAMYRAIQVATSMRAQSVVVYSIGLGNTISQSFLQQVANDPASSSFDPNQPIGQAVFAPTAADLQGVFQTIASQILLRITQ